MHVCVVPIWCVAAGAIEMVLADVSGSVVADVSGSVVAEEPQEDISEEHAEGSKPFGFLCLTCCCLCMVRRSSCEGHIDVCTVHVYSTYVKSRFTIIIIVLL